MQNLSSVFPNLVFPSQKQPQTPTSSTSSEMNAFEGLSLDALFSAGLDMNTYMSLLNGSAKPPCTPTKSTPSTSSVGASTTPDVNALISSFLRSSEAAEVKQPVQAVKQPSDTDLAVLLTMLSQTQNNVAPQGNQAGFDASVAAVLNNFVTGSMTSGTSTTSTASTGTPSSSSATASTLGATPSSKDAYCEICDKNFCNRYFLKTHKQKKHGIQSESPMDTPSKAVVTKKEDVKNEEMPRGSEEPVNGNMPDMDAMFAMLAQMNKQNNSGNQEFMAMMQQMNTSPQRATPAPVSPQKTESSQLMNFSTPNGHANGNQQQNNLMNMLPNFSGLPPFMLGGTDVDYTAAFNNLAPIANLTQMQGSGAMKPPKRQYSSTTKNYCDLCNKEVCNKYFLRTHMLKMHNIVIDENKTVIANIDTQEKEKEGSVSFRCDLCATNLKTRTELREHKQHVHGIQPITSVPDTPRSSSIPSKAPSTANSASGATPSTAFEFPPVAPSTATPSETMTASSQSLDFKCSQCDLDCGSLESLFEHSQSHHTGEISPVDMFKILTRSKPDAASDLNGSVTCDDEAMQITEEVALKMVAENLQLLQNGSSDLKAKKAIKFPCDQCKRGYSTQQRLDEHVNSVHQYKIKMSPKKPSKVVLSPNKINKLIKCFTCMKCHQRFNSSNLCKAHILQHLRYEKRATSLSKSEDVDMVDVASASGDYKENTERQMEFEDGLIESFMREENSPRSGTGGVLEHVVSQLSRRNSHTSERKLPEEKHSHTSGSASPMSMHTMPEGFAQPSPSINTDGKPFALQSFVMRELATAETGPIFPTELHAFLPVRSRQLEGNGPIRITFELEPAPAMDATIKNV